MLSVGVLPHSMFLYFVPYSLFIPSFPLGCINFLHLYFVVSEICFTFFYSNFFKMNFRSTVQNKIV
jgi:hypothetical protein